MLTQDHPGEQGWLVGWLFLLSIVSSFELWNASVLCMLGLPGRVYRVLVKKSRAFYMLGKCSDNYNPSTSPIFCTRLKIISVEARQEDSSLSSQQWPG